MPNEAVDPTLAVTTTVPAVATPPVAPTPESVHVAELSANIKARAEEQRILQAKLDEATKKLADIEAANLAEQGKYKELYEQSLASIKSQEVEATKRVMRAEIRAYAAGEGIIDPDIADLIPLPTDPALSASEVVKKHKEAKAHLYKGLTPGLTTAATPTSIVTAPITPAIGSAPTSDVSKMKPDEYKAHKANILRSMRRK